MFLQEYKHFFYNISHRRSLLRVEFDISDGKESSNVLNKICLFESYTFSLWYSWNHPKVLEKNSFDSWHYIKCVFILKPLLHQNHMYTQ